MDRRVHPILAAFAACVFFFLLAPLVIIVGAAFSDTTYLTFPPQGLTLRWFVNIFEIEAFRTTALTSLQVAFLGTALSLLIGIPAAYAINRYRVELPRWLSTIFVLPILVPEIVFGFSLMKSVTIGLGLPIFISLLVGHALLILPYSVRVVGASLAAFDFSVEEAAISLGCPPLKTFLTVVLPNIRAGVIAAFILAFITSINDCLLYTSDAADPDPCAYGTVLRSDDRLGIGAADVRDSRRHGRRRGHARSHLPDKVERS